MACYEFSGPRSFESAEVAHVFRATGNFHDAILDEIEVEAGAFRFLIFRPYFPHLRTYGTEGFRHARITLVPDGDVASETRDELSRLRDEDILGLRVRSDRPELEIMLTHSIAESVSIVECVIPFNPRESTFEWMPDGEAGPRGPA